MSQSLDLTINNIYSFPSFMTFREYYMSFIETKDPNIENGWGWFVDIELNSEPITILKPQFNNRLSQHPLIPNKIKKFSSIRSIKSVKCLHDTSMFFEMDEDDNKHRTNTYMNMVIYVIELTINYFTKYS